ncbi:MAG: efflux RND transporter periplasmic adaptor subunit [Spirochaetales bacterium]|nr:efflux RND transporter periplasmic adaptor subunit [Spirochaetales bacterium]
MKKPIVFLLMLFIAVSCQPEKKEQVAEEPGIAVHVAPVISGNASFPVYASGMLQVKDTVKLSFKTGGVIRQIYADEGASVNEGALLAVLDLSEINARVAQAKEGYERLKREYDRIKRLYEERVAPLQQLQDVETALSVAKSDLSVAEFNKKYSSIYAPSPGRILKRFMSANELVGSGMPVFLFAATNKNRVLRFGVSDRDLITLSINDKALVVFDVYPGESFTGWISEIAEIADPYTGTFEIELSINNKPNKRLVAGFIGSAVITPSRQEQLSLVSLDSVIEGVGNSASIFVIDPGKKFVIRKNIVVRKILDEYVAVSGGLEPGDLIVTKGAPYLQDNSQVRIIKTEVPEISQNAGIQFEKRESMQK